MIDEVTIASEVPAALGNVGLRGEGVHRHVARQGALHGQTAPEETLYVAGLRLRYCAETRRLVVRLNPNRYPNGSPNFPLRAIEKVGDLPLTAVAKTIAEAFGVRRLMNPPVESWLHPDRWRVTSISYPVDVQVGEDRVVEVLDAIQRVPRKHRSNRCTWTGSGNESTGVQFGSIRPSAGGVVVKAYNKGVQLRDGVGSIPGARLGLDDQHVIERARGVLRFEVSLHGATHVRSVFPYLESDVCPTLRAMVHGRTADVVLQRELRRLHLLDVVGGASDDDSPSVRALARILFARLQESGEQTACPSLIRALALVGRYVLREIPAREVAATWGGARSTLTKLDRQLRDLGIAGGGLDLSEHHTLVHFVERLREVRPSIWTASVPQIDEDTAFDRGVLCPNPYVHGDDDATEDEVGDDATGT